MRRLVALALLGRLVRILREELDVRRRTWILGGRFLSALARGRCLDGKPLANP